MSMCHSSAVQNPMPKKREKREEKKEEKRKREK